MAEPSLLTPDIVVEHIARGHAFDKHVLGYDHEPAMMGVNAFRATESKGHYDDKANRWVPPQRLGDDLFIETPDDLADYIKNTFLRSPDVIGYVAHENGGVNLFNTKDNVALHMTWNNKAHDFGTIYRYCDTPKRFDAAAEAEEVGANLLGVPFQAINNMDNPEAALKAVEAMIDGINTNPQEYLFKSNNPDSTVQNVVLGNQSRPGRYWKHDEVINAPHNVQGHSKEYAQKNGLSVDPTDYVCIKKESESELNIGRTRKSLRSGRVLREIKEVGINFDVEPVPAIA